LVVRYQFLVIGFNPTTPFQQLQTIFGSFNITKA